MTTCHFQAKVAYLSQVNFFSEKTINISSMYLLAPFTVRNFKKIIKSGSRLMRMRHFGAWNSPFTLKEGTLISIYLLVSFIVQILKTQLQ